MMFLQFENYSKFYFTGSKTAASILDSTTYVPIRAAIVEQKSATTLR